MRSGRPSIFWEKIRLIMTDCDAFDLVLIKLNSICKEVARADYSRIEELFELTKENQSHPLLEELAESFGMMVVQVEAREFYLKKTIEKLELQKALLGEHRSKKDELRKNNLKLRRLADLDGLTGIANRSRFDQYMENLWLRLKNTGEAVSLIFCDVDYFKSYNDNHGHQAGDLCLKRVAGVLDDSVKGGMDFVARYGGEEFVVVMPGKSAVDAIRTAENIRLRLQELNIEHIDSLVANAVTLSMGIATILPWEHNLPETLVAAADKALYRAKAEGRDRISMEKPFFPDKKL